MSDLTHLFPLHHTMNTAAAGIKPHTMLMLLCQNFINTAELKANGRQLIRDSSQCKLALMYDQQRYGASRIASEPLIGRDEGRSRHRPVRSEGRDEDTLTPLPLTLFFLKRKMKRSGWMMKHTPGDLGDTKMLYSDLCTGFPRGRTVRLSICT